MESVIEELRQRGFIAQMTESGLEKATVNETLIVYLGVDPTAASMHLGHLVPVMGLAHFQRYGHKVIALVGGGTGLIGDPSGRATERQLLSEEVVEENVRCLKNQLSHFMDFDGKNPAIMLNNNDWLSQFKLIEFLRDIGKHFTVNAMLAKDSVRSRLEDREQGISFTEFSYMLLQATDYLELHDMTGCNLQIGGSDQWGNITAGVDLIRRVRGASVHGLTFPLITKADGTKFGKSESGAIWLDPNLTSPYELYQYWLNADDRDVIRFLKIFTFLPLERINELQQEVEAHPEARAAQRVLAWEFTALVHGKAVADAVRKASNFLFGSDPSELDSGALEHVATAAPVTLIDRSQLEGGLSLDEALTTAELAKSKREARQLLNQGGVYVNNQRRGPEDKVSAENLILDKAVLLRVGKKKYGLLMVR
ncbi:MAG TPA: tyrosine--tRNA ligase [Ktedonobacteraceae bacterium]|nr:tyrosine--tRNA ligase [Ktedonobacteraceae bacterium]